MYLNRNQSESQLPQFYKSGFALAAAWNWCVSILTLLFYQWFFNILGMSTPQPALWFYLFLGSVFIFGIGYFMVSLDLSQNHAVIILGILGKIGVFAAFLYSYIIGMVHFAILCLGIVDVIWCVFFVKFLVEYSAREYKSEPETGS